MRQTAKGGSTIDTFSRLSRAGIIPAVALEHVEDAVPTAKVEALDSGKQELCQAVKEMTGGSGFDKIFEASGSRPGALALASVTKIRGVAVTVGIPSVPREYQTNKLVLKEVALLGSRVHTLKDFQRTVKMVEKLFRSGSFAFERLIAAEFPLEQLDDAIRLQESGTKNGKILIRIRKEVGA